MAVNSYRSVVSANESNASARTAIAYIREAVRQHDNEGAVDISKIDGTDCIRMAEGEGFYLYVMSMMAILWLLRQRMVRGLQLILATRF
jgi:hypothetical protein